MEQVAVQPGRSTPVFLRLGKAPWLARTASSRQTLAPHRVAYDYGLEQALTSEEFIQSLGLGWHAEGKICGSEATAEAEKVDGGDRGLVEPTQW
jgi:hypothetical protein